MLGAGSPTPVAAVPACCRSSPAQQLQHSSALHRPRMLAVDAARPATTAALLAQAASSSSSSSSVATGQHAWCTRPRLALCARRRQHLALHEMPHMRAAELAQELAGEDDQPTPSSSSSGCIDAGPVAHASGTPWPLPLTSPYDSEICESAGAQLGSTTKLAPLPATTCPVDKVPILYRCSCASHPCPLFHPSGSDHGSGGYGWVTAAPKQAAHSAAPGPSLVSGPSCPPARPHPPPAAIVGRLGTAPLAAVGVSTVVINFSTFLWNFLVGLQ